MANSIVQDSDLADHNLDNVDMSSAVQSITQSINQSIAQSTFSFMKNFNENLIGHPNKPPPEGFVKFVHPEWLYSYGQMQFVEPGTIGPEGGNQISLAYWDYNYGRPFFYGRGFFFPNPRVEGDGKFTFDPENNPHKEKEQEKGE